ncbi:uncharacterized protein OCT59_011759 [Rhizophagus irregularis]|uniref:uncharacterized protein n=1 Tax=Rhizophagus irregularis TaxID=588596 RepID=UPI00331F70B1|nr:hypothetical protein OCT59_011759 [Rhizophagus irregularis]
METELSEPNISDKDTNTVGTKSCSYCNKPFIKELWCEDCINSLEKLAKNNDKMAMFNLAICYKDGEGIEKNLEKAFHWYQKAAEKDHIKAMTNLAICFKNGEGTEKDLEKSFHWCQKSAENGDEEAMNNLSIYYKDGKGTEKNLEKAYYWHRKAAESNKASSKNKSELCNECRLPYSNYQWCQQCNAKRFQQEFSKWTSNNEFIDKFIQETQLIAKDNYEILEWIPYNKLSSINYHDQGGFGEIHKAIWLDGPIYGWNNGIDKWEMRSFLKYLIIQMINF